LAKASQANRGQPFEQLLDRIHAGYMARGEAAVFRTPAPFKAVRRDGKLLVGYFMPGPQDYVAFTSFGGLAIEAKSTKAKRWAFSNLPPEQVQALNATERIPGCHGLLLVQLLPANAAWAVPWANLRPFWSRWDSVRQLAKFKKGLQAKKGSASIGASGLDRIGRRFDRYGWLGPAAELLKGGSP